jgi:hypothetical protein
MQVSIVTQGLFNFVILNNAYFFLDMQKLHQIYARSHLHTRSPLKASRIVETMSELMLDKMFSEREH